MTTAADQETISQLKALVEEQEAFIKDVMKQPAQYATVAFKDEEAGKLVIVGGGGPLEIDAPTELEVGVGDTVTVVAQTGAVRSKGIISAKGEVTTVKREVSDCMVEVERGGGGVFTVFKNPQMKLKEGDRIVMDAFGLVVLEKLASPAQKYVKAANKVTWADIGGLEDAKEALKEIVELPHTEPELFAFYGYTPPKGVLLDGPPGCGKTMLGKATATAVANAGDGTPGFIYIKGPEVLNKFVGESEANIRAIFDRARAHREAHGSPAIIFIDEAEALLSRRGSGISSDMERTIVPAFLAEMDGLEEAAAVVILATNRPEQLDPAVVRDGRIDRKIKVTRPTQASALEIAKLNFAKTPVAADTSRSQLAAVLVNSIMDGSRTIYGVQDKDGSVTPLRLSDMISGSMIANIAERARSFALQRDRAAKTMTGVRVDDVTAAVDLITRETQGVSHVDEVREFAEKHNIDVQSFGRMAA